MRHTAAMDRLRQVPWDALRAGVAVPAIASVLEGVPAEREVDRVLRRNRGLSRDERTALVEAIFGVSLWRRRLRWETGAGSPAVLLASLLRDLAGVSEARAQALTGAAQAPRRDAAPERLADRWSLPDWLEAHLISELGEAAEAFCAAIAAPGPVCLRANRLLCTRDQLAARLLDEGVETAPTPRAPDGVFVRTSRANLFGTRAWREGLFEPQDEGSQLLGNLVEPLPGETVLDLCAGAGGKSLLLAAQGARVLAHDIDGERLERLRARSRRAQARQLIEIVDRPRRADRVLVDAPCSELGTLRRGPDARWRIDPALLASLPLLQRELLETAAPLAAKRLVYGTCTLNRAEN
ncbi:MAG: RsmB/NOP family class I SAM-dependent RNA methyltransferase, partial [Deltaproteobacteria bacterium]